jgi:hypothetical protein
MAKGEAVLTMSKNDKSGQKGTDIPSEGMRFTEEEMPVPLSERDALRLLEMLEHPPAPNEAARRAAEWFKKHYG